MRYPRIVLIGSSIALAVTLLFLGVYNFAFKQKDSASDSLPAGTSSPPGKQPARQKNKAIAPVTEEPIIGPVISEAGDSVKFYQLNNGTASEVGILDVYERPLSSKEIFNLNFVLWSPDKTKTISRTANDSFYVFDYTRSSTVALDSAIGALTWDNTGSKLIYSYKNPNNSYTLNIANSDGTNWKKLTNLDWPARITAIPQSSLIAFWNTPDAYSETQLNSIPAISGEVKKIFTGKFGADYLFSPNGDKILVSHSNEKGGKRIQLALLNNNGGEYRNLHIATPVSKVAWSVDGNTIYYTLPGSIPDNSVMPNDYYQRKFFTADTFWKFDLVTGKSERLVELGEITEKYDADQLFLSPGETFLFFVNRSNNLLYRIKLP